MLILGTAGKKKGGPSLVAELPSGAPTFLAEGGREPICGRLVSDEGEGQTL